MKNLIGNKNFYHIYLAGNFDNIYQYHENTNKQLENEMEQKKRCNINAYKCTKYSISQSYLGFFFKRPNHVQNLNLKYSRTLEISYS